MLRSSSGAWDSKWSFVRNTSGVGKWSLEPFLGNVLEGHDVSRVEDKHGL